MAERKLTGKKVLMAIAQVDFRDEELLEPKRILEEAGAQVTVASTSTSEATGMLGARITPDITIDRAASKDYDAVVVVGGMGSPTYLWNNKYLHAILKELDAQKKIVSGICLSGAVLGKAGVLQGRRATVWETPESLSVLKEGGAHYSKEPVVQDEHVITGVGPTAAKQFGNTIVAALEKATAHV